MKNLLSNIIKVTLAVFLLVSCSKDTLVENPPNILAGETVLQDYSGFESALNGVYNIARHGRWQSEKIENAVNGVDNMCSNYKRSNIFWKWGTSNSPTDNDLLETFNWLYEIVNASNTIIYFAQKPNINWAGGTNTPDNNKLRVIGEARALRAWAYRRLSYSWGDIPLTLDLTTTIKTDWERAPRLEVRKQAIRDYKFAQQYIPVEASLQGRMTKGAVQTLLAEMYLTINMPDSALFWCNQVINNPAYVLTTARYGVKMTDPLGSAFGDMFKEGNQNREQGNKEALWVFQFEVGSVDGQGNEMARATVGNYNLIVIGGKRPLQYTLERGGRGKAYFGPTKWWIDSYEKKDARAQNYILRTSFTLNDAATNAVPAIADALPAGYKYGDTIKLKWSTPISASYYGKPDFPYSRKADGADPGNMQADFAPTDQIYLRLAETYLLKAEAEFKLGQLPNAMNTINIIRNRSNATPIPVDSVKLNFILDERSRELHLEEERRMTLLRTYTWYDRTRKYNKFGGELITLRDTLFPIPQDVIDANLTKPFPQNPGF